MLAQLGQGKSDVVPEAVEAWRGVEARPGAAQCADTRPWVCWFARMSSTRTADPAAWREELSSASSGAIIGWLDRRDWPIVSARIRSAASISAASVEIRSLLRCRTGMGAPSSSRGIRPDRAGLEPPVHLVQDQRPECGELLRPLESCETRSRRGDGTLLRAVRPMPTMRTPVKYRRRMRRCYIPTDEVSVSSESRAGRSGTEVHCQQRRAAALTHQDVYLTTYSLAAAGADSWNGSVSKFADRIGDPDAIFPVYVDCV